MAKRKVKKTKGLKEWGQAFLLALILASIIRGFVVQSYQVASPKMEKTILTGDFILVNKWAYGARLPISVLSLPFFPSLYTDAIQLPYFRLPGFQSIKINDFLVFNYPAHFDPPIDKRETLVKRCVGLPGDTLQIRDKQVFLNNHRVPNTPEMQFNYRLVTNGEKLSQEFLQTYDIHEGGMVSEIGIYDFPLTPDRLEAVKSEAIIRYARELKDFPGENTQYIFPAGSYYAYNKDNFGPLVIPHKGTPISLNSRNIEIYKSIIVDFEQNTLEIKKGHIFINGLETKVYTPKNNYYFVLDDNRDNAKDSRYWGFLPESHIIGKAGFVWFSFDTSANKIRWKRIGKSLR